MARILIAEDESDIRDLVSFTLKFAGHEVRAAKDGQEVLEMALAELPDLILLDVRMPRMTGYEACLAIKANPVLKEVPVVFLSAKGQDAEIKAGLDAGADAYLLKPFGLNELTDQIKNILTNYGK
jgi:DNA-binding response OmpR family regulator